jgi:hypothetical protein
MLRVYAQAFRNGPMGRIIVAHSAARFAMRGRASVGLKKNAPVFPRYLYMPDGFLKSKKIQENREEKRRDFARRAMRAANATSLQ